jgi:hypothetical protein
MSNLKIITYNPKNPMPEFPVYVLSKGLNSGKPLEVPTINCFVVHAKSEDEQSIIKAICLGLWKTKSLYPFHVGSVIPFVRIFDFKTVLYKAISNARKTEKLIQKNKQIRKLEEMERTYLRNLTLIQDAQKAIYLSLIRSKIK